METFCPSPRVTGSFRQAAAARARNRKVSGVRVNQSVLEVRAGVLLEVK